jgi:hypothetical protein
MERDGISFPKATAGMTQIHNGFNDLFANGREEFGDYAPGPGTVHVSPLFRSSAQHDYRLRRSSPLIDAGLTCSPGGLSRIDAAGRARVARGRVDIGAREFGAGRPTGVTLFGTGGPNVITESKKGDVLCGMGGADVISAGGGADLVEGGRGPDQLHGEGGGDIARGGLGSDEIAGGRGDDPCLKSADGVRGNDTIIGGPGRDGFSADRGDDVSSVEFPTAC